MRCTHCQGTNLEAGYTNSKGRTDTVIQQVMDRSSHGNVYQFLDADDGKRIPNSKLVHCVDCGKDFQNPFVS